MAYDNVDIESHSTIHCNTKAHQKQSNDKSFVHEGFQNIEMNASILQ